jgi:hypothetical protein
MRVFAARLWAALIRTGDTSRLSAAIVEAHRYACRQSYGDREP